MRAKAGMPAQPRGRGPTPTDIGRASDGPPRDRHWLLLPSYQGKRDKDDGMGRLGLVESGDAERVRGGQACVPPLPMNLSGALSNVALHAAAQK